MNKMKNFKRRFSLSVPRTETIEETEFTEQLNHLRIHHAGGPRSAPGEMMKRQIPSHPQIKQRQPTPHTPLPSAALADRPPLLAGQGRRG
ncbi:hypothetical protein ANANG_G00244180 [Anguilla anguilla]|uniref:Uncharacterized protein n=1 Tax=Anguilla anguilla TaxID=7936 RepID=A0A9D3RLX2_ANGAN|nr:hypothetical protein ANANG_G00244180 [Anguilla anguilla]